VDGLPKAERLALRNAWKDVPAARRSAAVPALPGEAQMLPRKGATVTDSARGHPARLLMDGDTGTSWESRHGFRVRGRLHALRLNLERQASVTGVEVVEGQRKRPEYQLHIRRARLLFPDGASLRVERSKPTEPLQATFPERRASWVKLLVEEAFPHRNSDESHLSLAEVRVWGR
jgi:hypothetical protein